MLVEAKIAGERISTFLEEGVAVDYREIRDPPPQRAARSNHSAAAAEGLLAVEISKGTLTDGGTAMMLRTPASIPPCAGDVTLAPPHTHTLGNFTWDVPPGAILWTPLADKSAKFGSRDALKQIQRRKAELKALRESAKDTAPPPVLQSIDLQVERGSLVCLIGLVGSVNKHRDSPWPLLEHAARLCRSRLIRPWVVSGQDGAAPRHPR